ncbi:rhamnogalacturonan lyase [Termitidicoccus mucosus]|uniref:rhamnogalacturonan lyase n=1 Tax=Termitidicoccus mucosus TaxID=1184151 RepID=UPI0011AB7348
MSFLLRCVSRLSVVPAFCLCAAVWGTWPVHAAPSLMENLDRGIVAVRATETEVFVSWRLLGTEAPDTAFNLYRATDGAAPVRLNSAPLAGATCFTDKTADLARANTYSVRAIVAGAEQPASASKSWILPSGAPVRQYLAIPLQLPGGGTTPDGKSYTYDANDCSVGDLDGDGEYEIVVKWYPTNSKDNSQGGYTGSTYLDAYKLDGTRLWRIDLGRNIRSGAHYTQFIVYDLDGDGIAEIACKTADGTVDGAGRVIGDAKADYRNERGVILDGPEFLTIFNGRTGAAMATTDYVPARGGDGSGWGDAKGNRVDRFLACVAYLDGRRPSLVMCRGYYTRAVLAAWDWRDGKLTSRWVFDSEDGTPGNKAYSGQGAHSVLVGDVNGDGRDEIIYGAAVIGADGKGLYSTGLGHGDAQHMSVMDPARGGQQVFMVHENKRSYRNAGIEFRDARTGELIFGVSGKGDEWGKGDVGRGVAADIDPRTPGYEMWASYGEFYDNKGRVISSRKPRQTNFLAWWDGDLLRELLDGVTISKWNWETGVSDVLLTDPDCASNNGTKATPCLSADLFGDWREEVVWRAADSRELRIYTTTIPTEHRLPTLMHDRQYRLAIAWQNVAYNQPPHPSFFLGHGMKLPRPKPDIVTSLKELAE